MSRASRGVRPDVLREMGSYVTEARKQSDLIPLDLSEAWYNIVPENFDLSAVARLTTQAMDKCQVWNREHVQ